MAGMSSGGPLPYATKYNTYAFIFGFVICKTQIWVSSGEPLQYGYKDTTYDIYIIMQTDSWASPHGSLDNMQTDTTLYY